MGAIIATLLGQGLPLIAGAMKTFGIGWVKEKTGVDLSAADLTPEQAATLKQYELENEENLRQYSLTTQAESDKVELAYLADVGDARKMQIAALGQEDLFSKRFLYYFASGITLVTCVYVAGVTFATIPPENRRTVDTVLGFLLGTMLASIINYFFGTSRSSANKDATIQAAISAANPAPAQGAKK